jgi:3-oxoacyl-[acyl-carrier protein] reductase/meso-butanediol dehydrogenase/(S,S)-butanediol dehydrogenase/diacetyl reductase
MHDNLMSSLSKTVVITGGTRGIGVEITRAFLVAGYKVFVGARSRPIHSDFPSAANFIQTDVRHEADILRLVHTAVVESGRIDVLVNNAGYSEWKSIENITESFLLDMMKTNLFSAFWGCKAAASAMSPGSSIINISSMAGKRGSSNNSAYVATKFAMNGLTQSLCKELGPRGIRVNGLCPVLISSPGLIVALQGPDSPSSGDDAELFISKFAQSNSALGRMPIAAEVASACVYLASDAASAITGQNINVDCGVFPQ